ncbi:MAG TPA: O-acetyl-ADP-ribose deacetylase [Salinivirgaceae bacterium]|nr:O-acetyl-ADP-ribose deacetylase [Salinivirgaceae bacterium]
MQIKLIQGDITKITCDAIVNAANSRLAGGGGVDGAIHRAGGPIIAEQCRSIRETEGGCPTGEAVVTDAGNLPARYVIHTVGPIWSGGFNNEAELLASCYRKSLALAEKLKLQSIAFPNISTGIYSYPKQQAAEIAFNTVKESGTRLQHVQTIIFVCFDDENYRIYKSLLEQ